ncbi:hypothetical protein OAC63_04260 [Amylibacter sp.]|nr:hypothetical protein [Amylibacter sp.]
MARQQTFVLILSGVLLLTTTQNAFALSDDQRLLAKCEAVYAYSAHLAQMQNNIGLATNLMFRAARSTTSLFMISEVNGVVKGSVIDQFKQVGRLSKKRLDNRETQIMDELSVCDSRALPLTNTIEQLRKKLWGYTFQELQSEFLQKMKQTIGL